MNLEEHRKFWANVAKENGWYKQPFFIIAWINKRGEIIDSVSHRGLEKDIVVTV